MFGVGKFEKFDGRAILDDECDADTVGWAVRGNQDFTASKLGGEVGHFKRDVRHSSDKVGNRRIRFEAHPFHAEFAFLVTDDKDFQMLVVGLPRLRLSSGIPYCPKTRFPLRTQPVPGISEFLPDQRFSGKINRHRIESILEPLFEGRDTSASWPQFLNPVPSIKLFLEDGLAESLQTLF